MGLQELVDGVAAIVARGDDEVATTDAAAEVLRAELEKGLDLPGGTTTPDAEKYVMYPLHVAADGSFSIASAVWGVGQSTPIHDHTVWGVVGIHSGIEREERFHPREGAAPEPLDSHDWEPGQVTICCTSDQDIHRVECASDEPCVGIHIYGGDIGQVRRHAFDPQTGEEREFVSHWAQPMP